VRTPCVGGTTPSIKGLENQGSANFLQGHFQG
jgi:hypothetical protein